MATAVKNTPQASTASLFDRAAAVSLVGVVYVVGCFGIVFQLLPYVFWHVLKLDANLIAWQITAAFVLIVAATALIILGVQLLGQRAPRGTRAGIFVGVLGVLLILLLTRWASIWLEHWAYAGWFSPMVGELLTGAVGLGLLVVGGYYFLQPKFERYLVMIEDQGWFSVSTFKNQQGLRVRRGTILGILIIVGAGLWTLYSHGTLTRLSTNWELNVPFTGKTTIDLDQVFADNPDLQERLNSLARAKTPEEEQQRLTDAVVKFVQEARASNDDTAAPDVDTFLAAQMREKFGASGRYVVVDRYALRDFDNSLANYVKITDSGDSDFSSSSVVKKSAVDRVSQELRDKHLREPTTAGLPPIRGAETFATVQLLPLVQYTVLFLLAGVSAWMAWRIVHFPAFADFLIATEAELNKVSWTTRKKLVQDTIVVLVTVLLMAIYLFAMDQVWVQLLSWKPVRILQIQEKPPNPNEIESKPW
jgi:preprotein translocase SecE subunit